MDSFESKGTWNKHFKMINHTFNMQVDCSVNDKASKGLRRIKRKRRIKRGRIQQA